MNIETESKGQLYRYSADAVTYGRTVIGTLVAINILSGDRLLPRSLRHRSIGSAAGLAVLGAMDKLDGILARKGEDNGVLITKKDKEKDPVEDKKFNRRIMGAVAVRELVGGVHSGKKSRVLFAGLIGANLLATEDRDERMNFSRNSAVEGADTSAIKLNKYKTGLQNVGHTLASSPLANTKAGQILTSAVYSASTVMGEVGFRIADRIHRGEQATNNGAWVPLEIQVNCEI